VSHVVRDRLGEFTRRRHGGKSSCYARENGQWHGVKQPRLGERVAMAAAERPKFCGVLPQRDKSIRWLGRCRPGRTAGVRVEEAKPPGRDITTIYQRTSDALHPANPSQERSFEPEQTSLLWTQCLFWRTGNYMLTIQVGKGTVRLGRIVSVGRIRALQSF
jgi:hypothetical protein